MSELTIYLADHLAGARGGMALFRRTADHHQGTSHGELLNNMASEVEEDIEQLREIMALVGARENRVLSSAAVVAERLGRFKPNGRLFGKSALAYLVEVEGLRVAVRAKRCGWEALLGAADSDSRLPRDLLERHRARAADQEARLGDLHAEVARHVFAAEQ